MKINILDWFCYWFPFFRHKKDDTDNQTEYKNDREYDIPIQIDNDKSENKVVDINISEKNCLILVIRASNISLIKNIKNKGKIEQSDCENLYQSTIYLNYENEDQFLEKWQKLTNEKKFYISNEQEYSEGDIFLIKVKLNNTENRFNPNLDQIERYDAFMNLANLAIDVEVSERLDMEAYEKFNVYNR
ncbi:hypothetical protein [Geminocystis sp. GBBB08]|uniref:hypothetical protein n=1 Tax=Geminocystis sp. GBBB08 TaxID=2604140 RepID=UPI0027E2E82F|nr:hypothetical protein [Geminocystis sp. GBBB08]MBL1211613.1 hypothetical protein [Geminocystis sp. GBBB08]